MSTADAEHTLTLKNTTQNDSGDYYVHVGQFSHKIQLTITEPSMAVNMDEKNTYMDAIKTGIEVRQYVRIQVIGKDRVGKTSLVRRLLFLEDGSYDGKSTDGIEVDRKCQIRRKDGQWFVGDVETEKKERIKRIHLAVNTKQNKSISKLSQLPTEEYVSDLEKKKMEQKQNATSEYFEIEETHNFQDTLISDDNVIEKEPFDVLSKINDDTQHASITLAASTSDGKQSSIPDKMEKQQNNDLKNHELVPNSSDQITEMMVSKMDEILAYAKIEKDKMKSEGLVECGIWDFAGQKDYYATHQTFFTPNAIYLLVADIEDDIKPITHNEDDCNCIGDYIDFWFDSVHCFCKDRSAMKLCPPVVMVCTGTDKFEKVEDRKKEYEANIRQVFGKQKKSDHRRGIYFISNTNFRAEDKKEIKRLRKHISDIALEMNYFAEKLPTKWIQLENALEHV
ncbi:uncharacterized protein LOC143084249 [Mytilus galloprovincialis]|uniref:uncharacterized protein LOC143084249 n=1 Tax=Mytilus galloprovincialis TaxID=29158 RepID=UPI003F7B9B07